MYIFNNIFNHEKQKYLKLGDLIRFILDLLVIVNYLRLLKLHNLFKYSF